VAPQRGIRRPPSWATTVSAQQLRELYLDQGLTAAQIAARHQVSPSQVYQALRRHHLRRDTPGPRPIPPPPAGELRELYVHQRHSLDQLASHYRVSPWTVRRWLRTAGVRRQRPRGHPWATTVSADLLRQLYVQ
jgi:transposase-like protein